MSKTAIIYWSGTGNTESMAFAVLEGVQSSGASADLFKVSDTTASAAAAYDTLILGCPAMGSEVLEEDEFEPFFTELEGSLSGKKVALFGSYGWGDGEWMRNWEQRVINDGAVLVNGEGLTINEAPDDSELEECRALGKAAVSA